MATTNTTTKTTTKTETRINLITMHWVYCLKKLGIKKDELDKHIKEFQSKKFSKLEIIAFTEINKTKTKMYELIISVDWDKYILEINNGNNIIKYNPISNEDLLLEYEKSIIQFFYDVKRYNFNLKCFFYWSPNVTQNDIDEARKKLGLVPTNKERWCDEELENIGDFKSEHLKELNISIHARRLTK